MYACTCLCMSTYVHLHVCKVLCVMHTINYRATLFDNHCDIRYRFGVIMNNQDHYLLK